MIILFALGAVIALTIPAVLAGATVSLACLIIVRAFSRNNRSQ